MTESDGISCVVLEAARLVFDGTAELSDRFVGDSLDLIVIITEIEEQLKVELLTDEYLSALCYRPVTIQDIADVTTALVAAEKAKTGKTKLA